MNEDILVGIPTAEGVFVAGFSEKGLISLEFPGRGEGDVPVLDESFPDSVEVRSWCEELQRMLGVALRGSDVKLDVPLDLPGTPFQRAVWQALKAIPAGEVRSYTEIARQIGRPKAVRAVGAACGHNPLPVIVPCHRVVTHDGRLGGFSGGLDWKRRLLNAEQGFDVFTRQGAPGVLGSAIDNP